MASVGPIRPSVSSELGTRKRVASDSAVERPAKQGRPTKLSHSQRRKLARLYLYTNASVDDVYEILSLTRVVIRYALGSEKLLE